MLDLIVRGGTVVTPQGAKRLDIGILDGQIAELSEEITSEASETLNASDLHVFPGLVDAHVHLNEPGRTHWEGFETGSRALAAGGATTFVDMPLNSSPPVLNRERFEEKARLGEQKSLLDFALWGGLTPLNLDLLPELAEAGVIGFKAFMSNSGLDEFPAVDDLTLYEGMRLVRELGLVVATHAESDEFTRRLTEVKRASGGKGVQDYLSSRPVVTEREAVGRALLFAEETGCALHLVHVSSGEAIAQAYEAKGRGVDVTVETCPHYLHFTAGDVERLGAVLKCAPPIRPETVRNELWAQVLAGHVDIVGSDHSPAPPDLKVGDDFFTLWGGISGAQSTLNVLLEDGHHRHRLPLEVIAALGALNPSDRFRLTQKGRLIVGADADFVLVGLDESFTLTELFDRHEHNPYYGETFRGHIHATYQRGRPIYANGKFNDRARGKLLKPEPTAMSDPPSATESA